MDDWKPDCITVELPRALTEALLDVVEGLPVIRALAYHAPGGEAVMIAADPCDALIEAMRLGIERGIPVELIDTLEGGIEEAFVALPDEMAVTELGLAEYVEQCAAHLGALPVTGREEVMAARLRVLAERHERVLHVGGLGHYRNLAELLRVGRGHGADPRWREEVPGSRVVPLEERQLGHVLREIPRVAWYYERWRHHHRNRPFRLDDALRRILRRSARVYEREYDEKVNLTEWRGLFQFGRNLSLVRGRLQPTLYELVTAAKGCIDDDFGAICFEEAVSYPPNRDESDDGRSEPRHQSLSLHCDFGSGMERLRHAYPFPEIGELEFHFRRRRPTDLEKQIWRSGFGEELWNGSGICSWPPEDEFIESFFRRIRQRAFLEISENHSTVEEFAGSTLDGLDVRETMRRWHEKKIYVRRERVPPGKVGPVVLVWRDFPIDEPGLWQTCLYAENQNESDIVIYSRPLGDEMIGPGITRTEYFGILSVWPACHIPDMWNIHALRRWGSCARLLIASAILLSEERFIAVVAERPPDAELRSYAREHGRAIVYLPLATFSRSMLKRARQCHILASRSVRSWADDYIPPL